MVGPGVVGSSTVPHCPKVGEVYSASTVFGWCATAGKYDVSVETIAIKTESRSSRREHGPDHCCDRSGPCRTSVEIDRRLGRSALDGRAPIGERIDTRLFRGCDSPTTCGTTSFPAIPCGRSVFPVLDRIAASWQLRRNISQQPPGSPSIRPAHENAVDFARRMALHKCRAPFAAMYKKPRALIVGATVGTIAWRLSAATFAAEPSPRFKTLRRSATL